MRKITVLLFALALFVAFPKAAHAEATKNPLGDMPLVYSIILGNSLPTTIKAEVTYCRLTEDRSCRTITEEIESFEKFFFRPREYMNGEEEQFQPIFHIKATEIETGETAVAYMPFPGITKSSKDVEVAVVPDESAPEKIKIEFWKENNSLKLRIRQLNQYFCKI